MDEEDLERWQTRYHNSYAGLNHGPKREPYWVDMSRRCANLDHAHDCKCDLDEAHGKDCSQGYLLLSTNVEVLQKPQAKSHDCLVRKEQEQCASNGDIIGKQLPQGNNSYAETEKSKEYGDGNNKPNDRLCQSHEQTSQETDA
ncbi:MAG: hypothetical protein LQ338_002712 [Usnochroma carphineum]|nr:MAG: hypothetical protein LQ338_002712 [Usnochroma carphineum]